MTQFTKRKPRETLVEKHIIKRAKEYKGDADKWGVNSFPDRIVSLPDGHHFLIEAKRKGETATLLQATRHKRLRALGWRVYVCDSKAEVDEVFHREIALYGF